jgi:hypothetical protein
MMTGGTWFWFTFGFTLMMFFVGRLVGKWLVLRSAARDAWEEMDVVSATLKVRDELRRGKRIRTPLGLFVPSRLVSHLALPAPLDYRGQGHTLATFRRRGPGNSSPWANLTPAELREERDVFLVATAAYRPVELLERWANEGEVPAFGSVGPPLGWIYAPSRAEEETT